jgi:ribosomal protein S24E
MPYEKIEDVPPQFRSLAPQPGGENKIDLTLEQANEIARMFDGLKGTEGIDSPAAIAITNFRRMYKVEGGKWVKRSENEKMAEFDEIDMMSVLSVSTPIPKVLVETDKKSETFELKDFPFFKSGTHNGRTYSESDLDRLVSNFYSLQPQVKPVLKLGHGGQKFLRDEGYPAAGWIDKLKKVGQVLYADIKNIPKRIYELLKSKAYQRPSAEIYADFQDDKGQKYGLTLSAIALLGADIPAIKSLPDIEALFNNEVFTSVIACYNENFDRNKGGLIMADDPKPTTEQEIAKLQAELKSKADRVAKLEADAAQIKETQRVEGIKASIAKYKESGKVLPVQEVALSTLLLSFDETKVLKYSDNGTSQDLKQSELLFKVLDALPNVVQFAELSQQRGKQDAKGKEKQYRDVFMSENEKTLALDGIDVAELAEKIAIERKIGYTEALIVASEQLEK